MNVELVGVYPEMNNEVREVAGDTLSLSLPGDRFGSGLYRDVSVHKRGRVRGDWEIECQSAVKVEDPEKAANIFGRYGIGFRHPPQEISYNALQKLLGHLRNPDIVALEKVLSGGGKSWLEKYHNIVVNQGLDELLNQTLAAQAQITAWYVALFEANYTILATTTAANFTANATESTAYSESVRQTWTPNGVSSSQSVSNSSSKATFSINAPKTMYGAALLSSSTKSGTSGKMYAGGQFASSRAVISGDSLLVTATFSSADDGV